MYRIMTPGPTEVAENVRIARSLPCTNPDLDGDFVEFYRETCALISKLLKTENETLILGGEGILGLEAACASLTEPKDRVLVLDNGIFGEGFADFVSMYRGIPVLYSVDRLSDIDAAELADFLEKDHDFKYATVVHGDTPSGVLNDISAICPLLKRYGILTVVDAVSTMFGEPINADASQIDILCGGSQKVVSAPPGLTMVTVSQDAVSAMKRREVPIASFYANLLIFEDYYKNKWFPYTMPISDINGLRVALDNIASDTDILCRHARIAKACREAIRKAGLHLHLNHGFSNTVTVFDVPEGISAKDILERMKMEHNILIAGSFGSLAGKVIRIGHMGENATAENMEMVLEALDEVLSALGVPVNESLCHTFKLELQEKQCG